MTQGKTNQERLYKIKNKKMNIIIFDSVLIGSLIYLGYLNWKLIVPCILICAIRDFIHAKYNWLETEEGVINEVE